MHVSLHGFAAGPNGELDFLSYDEELAESIATGMEGKSEFKIVRGYPFLVNEEKLTEQVRNYAVEKDEFQHWWNENLLKEYEFQLTYPWTP